MEVKQAVARVFGEEVAIITLRQLQFDAGIEMNRTMSAMLRPQSKISDDLMDLISTGDEPAPKILDPHAAMHLVNLTTAALRDLASITESDDLGRKSCPHAWLNDASNTTGRPHIGTVGTIIVDAVNFRAGNSNDHAQEQIKTLLINGHMTEQQVAEAKQINETKAAEDANKSLRDRLSLVPEWKADYEAARQLSIDELAEEIEATIKHLGWDVTNYVKAACSKSVDFAKDNLLAGKYTNLSADVALAARTV